MSAAELAKRGKVSRQLLSNWLNGTHLPNEKKLGKFLSALRTPAPLRRRIAEARGREALKSPKIRPRKASDSGDLPSRLKSMKKKPDTTWTIRASENPRFDYVLLPNHPFPAPEKKIPVVSYLNKRLCVYRACVLAMEAMRISESRRAVVLVDEIQPNQFGELYESNGIEIMTPRQFSERKWFPPLADQSELDLND
jgi:transcriptional regulator with XRE-family HTH domain